MDFKLHALDLHRGKEGSRRHPTASQPSKRTSRDQLRHVPRQAAKQASEAKDRIREDEAWLPSEYVAHLAVQRPK